MEMWILGIVAVIAVVGLAFGQHIGAVYVDVDPITDRVMRLKPLQTMPEVFSCQDLGDNAKFTCNCPRGFATLERLGNCKDFRAMLDVCAEVCFE